MANQPFRFSDLPGEIRNKVYKLLLCNFEEPHDFSNDSLVTVPEEITRYKHNIDTAILRICRSIHKEARDVLLKNQFVRVEAHFAILSPAIRALFIAKRIPVITSNQQAVDKFKDQFMTYSVEEKTRDSKHSFTCLILHRHFDLFCRAVANADVWMPEFGSKTRHTLTLHDPYQHSSALDQKHLLEPFRRHARGLRDVIIHGKIQQSLADAVISEVKRNPSEDPDNILRELNELKSLGAEYFKQGDSKMASESWAKACIRIRKLQGGPIWAILSTNKSFVEDLSSVHFALNLNLAQNNIRVMEQTPDDMEHVESIANSALFALQSAFEQLSQSDGWEPTPSQMGKLWFRKAKVHRLCKDYRDAWQAIDFADAVLPRNPSILEEKRRIQSLMG